jgi:hypothetical protein
LALAATSSASNDRKVTWRIFYRIDRDAVVIGRCREEEEPENPEGDD